MTRRFRFDKGREPRTFCGPMAISVLTGRPAHEVNDVVLCYRNRENSRVRRPRKARVTSMTTLELTGVLREFGLRAYTHTASRAATLGQFVTAVAMRFDQPFVVQVPGHFLTVRGGMVIDGATPPGGQWFADHWCRKRRVVQVLAVK
jgi:hypothetical protein